jgi:hypothetical protein
MRRIFALAAGITSSTSSGARPQQHPDSKREAVRHAAEDVEGLDALDAGLALAFA